MVENDSNLSFQSLHVPVKFLSKRYTYSCNEDLVCKYELNNYAPQEGDRIAIFKVGWLHVKDYEVFEWAPVGFSGDKPSVTFHRHILPKTTSDMYQICYITAQNELQGASESFQFVNSNSNVISSSPTEDSGCSSKSCNSFSSANSSTSSNVELELSKLKEENFILKESIKALITLNQISPNKPVISNTGKNYDKDIEELKEVTLGLRKMLTSQQQEINSLKYKIKEGAEKYKKLYVEKITVQKKYNSLKHSCDKKSPKKINTDFLFDFNLQSLPTLELNKNENKLES